MPYTNENDPRIWGGRLQKILERWQQHPGSAPGGTGSTGLLSNDAQGWSDMLNEQSWALGKMSDKPLSFEEAPYKEQIVSAQPGSLQGLRQAASPAVAPAVDPEELALEKRARYFRSFGRVPSATEVA